MTRPIAYIHTADVARARPFYEGVLGMVVSHADNDVLHGTIAGGLVRVITVDGHKPSGMSVFGLETGDIEVFLIGLKEKGVIAERWHREQDAHGVWTGPDGERIAWFRDPEGNMLSVVEAPRLREGERE
jgi:catechol 2,3-dioxygenase-like lactoylglutathione lyase family enzyme